MHHGTLPKLVPQGVHRQPGPARAHTVSAAQHTAHTVHSAPIQQSINLHVAPHSRQRAARAVHGHACMYRTGLKRNSHTALKDVEAHEDARTARHSSSSTAAQRQQHMDAQQQQQQLTVCDET